MLTGRRESSLGVPEGIRSDVVLLPGRNVEEVDILTLFFVPPVVQQPVTFRGVLRERVAPRDVVAEFGTTTTGYIDLEQTIGGHVRDSASVR